MIALMRPEKLLLAFALLLSTAACSPFTEASLDCPAPTLAASEDMDLSLSCVELITYEETIYHVGCAPIHPTRIGEQFVKDGGETGFSSARSVEGLSRSKVFVLEGRDPQECRRKEKVIAASATFTRLDAGLMRVRVGAANERRLARQRAPWIIPGRNEYPQALKLDAVASAEGIRVTNRNRFTWRKCDQIQINDEIGQVWETGEYLDSLAAGASRSWALQAFGKDANGIEELTADFLDEIEGKPFIIMCRAPRGRAFGRDIL